MDRTNTTLRNTLAEGYFPLVQLTARRLAGQLPTSVSWEELVGPGCEGMLQALQGFDPARGVTFTTYCGLRVGGAMLDYLRQQDHVSRHARLAAKRRAAWLERQAAAGASTAPEAMPDELHAQCARHQVRNTYSIATVVYANPDGQPLRVEDLLPGVRDGHDAEEFWEHTLRGTNDTERAIVLLYFRCDWTMQEIGSHVGLSESRVSQLMAQLLARLRTRDDAASVAGWLPATRGR